MVSSHISSKLSQVFVQILSVLRLGISSGVDFGNGDLIPNQEPIRFFLPASNSALCHMVDIGLMQLFTFKLK